MTHNPNVHSIFSEMFDLPAIPRLRISSPRERIEDRILEQLDG
jgi:hypothetical protein